MTATDELRKLLDERGVEYYLLDESIVRLTMWQTCYEGLRHECQFDERHGESKLEIWDCTPEQAIAATLGTPERTCHIEERYIDWYCDACFKMVGTCDTISELFIDGNAIKLWNYCPYCGARVERREQ